MNKAEILATVVKRQSSFMISQIPSIPVFEMYLPSPLAFLSRSLLESSSRPPFLPWRARIITGLKSFTSR